MKNLTLLITFTLSLITSLRAVEIQNLIQDTQKMTQKGETTNMVWWIPTEFWKESLNQSPGLTPKQIDDFIETLEDYTTFVVVNMNAGPIGGMKFRQRDEIETKISLKVNDKKVRPIPIDELNPDARNLFAMMKPLMGQMLGQFGQGMEFFVYSNKSEDGLLINPLEEGELKFTSFDEEFKWTLPLGSLLPPVIDPETNEIFPGNYKFNPFTGSKLKVK